MSDFVPRFYALRFPFSQFTNIIVEISFRFFCKMARSALDEMSTTGAFIRTASTFRNLISRDQSSQFPAESGRYHLYISYACPWASRCLAYLKIKGLEKAISFSVDILFP